MMSTRPITTSMSVKQIITAIRQLSDGERMELEREFLKLQGQPANSLPKPVKKPAETEASLLARIQLNSSLPEAAQRRFNRLRRKLQEETIGESELTELQGLWGRVEAMNVERLEALIELARLRKTDVKTLMDELGLNKKRNVF